MAVWITQWLCAARHCAFMVPWDDRDRTAEQVVQDAERMASEQHVNMHCGICGGGIRPEHGRTRFTSLMDALPELLELQRRQIDSRRILDAMGMTVEKAPPDHLAG